MKNNVIALLTFLISFSAFSQVIQKQRLEFKFMSDELRIKKEKIKEARFISDIITTAYPAQGDADFLSTEVFASVDGKAVSSRGTNDTLTAEQKQMLNNADLGSDFSIKIKFKYKGPASIREKDWAVSIIPATEAEYMGGNKQMTEYLNKNFGVKISSINTTQLVKIPIVKFCVNEEGKIVDAEIFASSLSPELDELFLDAINEMPNWKPAEDAKGIKVKQEFKLGIPSYGGC